jgi:UTP--glucose-1-phosphate uridylyltransferase
MNKIKKAVILAAGLNSRMLPLSKVIPKVLLPYKDKLTAQYLVEECVNSGVSEVIFVVRHKHSLIERFFRPDPKLNFLLLKHNKKELVDKLSEIESACQVDFVQQKEPKGEADAIICAEDHIEGEDFAVLLGDTIYISEVPALEQLLMMPNTEDRKIIMGDSRFIITRKGFELLQERHNGREDKFDKRIEDEFSEEEIAFYSIAGQKIRVGELEKYKKLFVD